MSLNVPEAVIMFLFVLIMLFFTRFYFIYFIFILPFCHKRSSTTCTEELQILGQHDGGPRAR